MSKTYYCAMYLRLSKEDENKSEESSSIESQRMIIKSFAKFQQLEIIEEYVDDGYSGSNFERPAFKRMLEDINNKKINCVITKDLSRLGREIYQTGTFIEEYFELRNVRYIAINDSYDSLEGDSMLALRLGVNDLYLRDVSKKIKSSFRERQKQGKYMSTSPLYGYKKDPNDKNKLIVDPESAKVVKRIFRMFINGQSTHSIAKCLTMEKIPIPVVYKNDSRATKITVNDGLGVWRHQTIKSMLDNPTYIGNLTQNKFNKVKYNSKKVRTTSKDEWVIVENTHEAIINKIDFEKVAKILNSKQHAYIRSNNNYIFSGLLTCKECGHKLGIVANKKKKGNHFFTQCNYFTRLGKFSECTNHKLDYGMLEKDLIDLIKKVYSAYLTEYNKDSLMNNSINAIKNEYNNILKMIEDNDIELKKLEQNIEKLYVEKFEGKIPENVANNLLDNYSKKLKFHSNEQKKLEESKNIALTQLDNLDFEKCNNLITNILNNKEINRAMMCELINKIEVDKNNKVEITFNFNELMSFA